ncbi:MAG: hypothetical protein ACLUI7_04220 [Coprococcus sp.]
MERHRHTGHISIGYLKGYGLKEGAGHIDFMIPIILLL